METLYEIVGKQRLNQIVNAFYDKVFVSPVIGHLFKDEGQTIRRKQELFLTQFLGGPPLYSQEFGHPKMRMRHLPHKITEEGKEEWLKLMQLSINEVLGDDPKLANALYECFPRVAQHMVNS